MFNSPSSDKMTISYEVTPEFANQQYVETGKRLTFNSVAVSITVDTPEKRALQIEWNSWGSSKILTYGATRKIGTLELKPAVINTLNLNFSGGPKIEIKPIQFAHTLTEEEALEHMRRMSADFARLAPDLGEMMTAFEDYLKQARAAAEQTRNELKEQQQQKRESELNAAMTINWGSDGKAIVNLKDALTAACRYFDSEWAREVVSINYKKQDGFMYNGDFITDRKTEIVRPTASRVFIVKVNLSKRSGTHFVVIMKTDGTLEKAAESDDLRSWALDLRDKIADLLPRTDEAKTRSMSATDAEWEALKKAAAERGTSISALLLDLAAVALPDFPRNQTTWGGAERFEAKAES